MYYSYISSKPQLKRINFQRITLHARDGVDAFSIFNSKLLFFFFCVSLFIFFQVFFFSSSGCIYLLHAREII